MKRVLTGIKPTGMPHLGNLLGSIRPALELAEKTDAESFFFVADAHALTAHLAPEHVRDMTDEIAATWLVMGLDPQCVTLYRQSRIPQDFELFWILSCVTPKGLMNRAHAYKAVIAENATRGLEDQDVDVCMGLYNYPVLMSADILLFQAHQIPVGKDQMQHLEIARDVAGKFNQLYGETFILPEAVLQTGMESLVGIDGRKMSKSYGNVIPLFESTDVLRSLVFKIKTNSQRPEEPKDSEGCPLFNIYRHFASQEACAAIQKRYQAGIGWGEMKEILFETLDAYLSPKRLDYKELREDRPLLSRILEEGEERARAVAEKTMEGVRLKVGLR